MTSREFSSQREQAVRRELQIDRRNLPHWQLGGSSYFVTYRCDHSVVLAPEARDAVIANWRHWLSIRYILHALVVMPDHVHVLITPMRCASDQWYALETILHTNKAFSARTINDSQRRHGRIWQDERHDRIVRNEEEFWEKWNYIVENPARAGIVEEPADYKWFFVDPQAMDLAGIDPERRP